MEINGLQRRIPGLSEDAYQELEKEYFNWIKSISDSKIIPNKAKDNNTIYPVLIRIISNPTYAIKSFNFDLGKTLVPDCPACGKPFLVSSGKCFSCGFIVEKLNPGDLQREENINKIKINNPIQEKEHKILPEEKNLNKQTKLINIQSKENEKNNNLIIISIVICAIISSILFYIAFSGTKVNNNLIPESYITPLPKNQENISTRKSRNETYYITNRGGTNLRDNPGIKSKIITLLPYRTSLKIIDESQSLTEKNHKYYQVQTFDSKTGWVYAGDKDDWLSTTEPQQIAQKEIGRNYIVISPNGVNLRTEPLNTSEKIGKLEKGDIVTILEKQNSMADAKYLYYKVRAMDATEGWAYAGDNDEWFDSNQKEQINENFSQEEADIREILLQDIKNTEAKDIDATMADYHPESPIYENTKLFFKKLFKTCDLHYELESMKILSKSTEEARVKFTLVTRKVKGPAFRDNRGQGIILLKKYKGQWKIFSNQVDKIDYLN